MADYRTVTAVASVTQTIYNADGTASPNSFDVEADGQSVVVVDPYIEIEQTDEGAVVTVTDTHGVTQATIYNGPEGPRGETGPAGGVTSVNGKTGAVILGASDIGAMIPFAFDNSAYWDYDGSIQAWIGIMTIPNTFIHDTVSPVDLFPEMPLTDTVLSAWATNYPDVTKVKLLAQLTQRGDSIIISVRFETVNGSMSPVDYNMTISGYVLVGGV